MLCKRDEDFYGIRIPNDWGMKCMKLYCKMNGQYDILNKLIRSLHLFFKWLQLERLWLFMYNVAVALV